VGMKQSRFAKLAIPKRRLDFAPQCNKYPALHGLDEVRSALHTTRLRFGSNDKALISANGTFPLDSREAENSATFCKIARGLVHH
jgi:hypothetical protein